MIRKIQILPLGLTLGIASYVSAGFLNNSVNLRVLTTDGDVILLDQDQGTRVVDETTEYPQLQGSGAAVFSVPIAVDLDDSTISFDFSQLGAGRFLTEEFNGYIFTDLNNEISPFLDVQVIEDETTLPVTNDQLAFNENEIRINVSGISYNSSSFLKLSVNFPWYESASKIQPDGWRYFDWFKGFEPEGENWIFHGRHGWLYVLADDTSGMFLWDVALGRWMYTNATAYPWMYAYGPDEGWVFFFEGGRPGARYFMRGDNGNVVSEDDFRSDL